MASTSSERSRYLAIEVVVSIVVDIPTCKDLSRACHGSSVPSQKAPHRLIHRVSPAESLRFVQFVEQIDYEKICKQCKSLTKGASYLKVGEGLAGEGVRREWEPCREICPRRHRLHFSIT